MSGATSTIVIDNGSWTIKAGLAGKDAPNVVFRSMVGKPRPHFAGIANLQDMYVGDEAERKRHLLSLSYPIRKGVDTDWDSMEKVWHHAFHEELKVKPEEHRVLLTEGPLEPKANREKMAQLMFETFLTPAIYVAIPQVLSIYASGRTTGLVVSSGFGASYTVPVDNGYVVSHAIRRLDYGGYDLTFNLERMLMERYNFTAQMPHPAFSGYKEKSCYVALDYDQELQKKMPEESPEHSYQVPDGQIITLRNERFRCPEALFQPSFLQYEKGETATALQLQGIHSLAQESVLNCDAEAQTNMYASVVLDGGSTIFPGFADRMQKELTALAHPGMKVKVLDPPQKNFGAWIGGSILASMPAFEQMWISKQEYEESGPSIVHRCGTK